MAARNLPLNKFLREVKDRHTLQRARPFCFILGAGASFESEIPTGGVLVDRWLADMHGDEVTDGLSIEKWATAEKLGIKGFAYERRAEFYGKIYARRFEGTHDTGHAELQSLLSGKEPSFGYSILAYILANTQHKAVITTNFDNLVADALYLYSNSAPILCVHESLAGFVTPQLDRPLVVKIHRDLLFSPRNADDEIDKLDLAWDLPLRTLFSHFTPIFIGYGGNDGSLMGFLEKLEPPVPDRFYWCVRAGTPPNDRVAALLKRRNGALVQIPGFDQLMLLLKGPLAIPDLLPFLQQRHLARTERYTQQLAVLSKSSLDRARAPEATAEERAVGNAVAEAVRESPVEDTPASLLLHAQGEPDVEKAEARYRAALARFPSDGNLIGAFAEFLADKRQRFDEAEELLKRALTADPENPSRLHDYGQFLWYSRGDGRAAEPLLRKAIEIRLKLLGAEHLDTLRSRNNLANALRAQGKYVEAEQVHRAVLASRERVLGAEHPDTLSSQNNLAITLQAQGKHAEAEQEHRAALTIELRVHGAEHPDTLSSRNNLANALQRQGKHAEAEQEHRAVFAIREELLSGEHPHTLSSRNNLADTLQAQGKNAEAEQEHRTVLTIRERVLGTEHPDTSRSRNNLAAALQGQGKHAQAEQEHRAVLASRERVLGSEHPDVFVTCYNLALCLAPQDKLREAREFAERAKEGWKRTLGEDHRDYRDAVELCENLK